MGKVNKVDVERVRKLIKHCKNKNIFFPMPDTLRCNSFVTYLRDNHIDLFKILIKRVGLKMKDFKRMGSDGYQTAKKND